MAVAAEKNERVLQGPDGKAEAIQNGNQIKAMRAKLNMLVDDLAHEGAVSFPMLARYRKAASENEGMTLKNLEEGYGWMKERVDRGIGGFRELQRSMDESLATGSIYQADRDFLMNKLILRKDIDVVGQFDTISKDVTKTMAGMKLYKERFTKYGDEARRLAGEKGVLRTDANTTAKIPTEEAFVKMDQVQRKEAINTLYENLEKAKDFANNSENPEVQEMVNKYRQLLGERRDAGVIGQKTMDAYLDAFRAEGAETKQSWLNQFDEQMRQYEVLWNKIGTTFAAEPEALAGLNAMRETHGYHALSAEFGFAIEDVYARKLGRARNEQGLIGEATYQKFMTAEDGIEKQPLDGKIHYLHSLNHELERYKMLEDDISALRPVMKEEEKASFDTTKDTEGYTLRRERYRTMKGKKDEEAAHANAAREIETLKGGLKEEVVADDVQRLREMLGVEDKEAMALRLDRELDNAPADRHDENTAAKELRAMREQAAQKQEQKNSPPESGGVRGGTEKQKQTEDFQSKMAGLRRGSAPAEEKADNRNEAADLQNDFASLRKQSFSREVTPTESPLAEAEAAGPVEVFESSDKTYTSKRLKGPERDIKLETVGIGSREGLNLYLSGKEKADTVYTARQGSRVVQLSREEKTILRDILKKDAANDNALVEEEKKKAA